MIFRDKIFQELGTNLEKKDQKKKKQNSQKRNKTQEKWNKSQEKGTNSHNKKKFPSLKVYSQFVKFCFFIFLLLQKEQLQQLGEKCNLNLFKLNVIMSYIDKRYVTIHGDFLCY